MIHEYWNNKTPPHHINSLCFVFISSDISLQSEEEPVASPAVLVDMQKSLNSVFSNFLSNS